MVEAWYLLIAFGLGWWSHPKFIDTQIVRDGCPVEVGESIPMPPPLKDQFSPKEFAENRAAHRSALRVCNQRIKSIRGNISKINSSIEVEK